MVSKEEAIAELSKLLANGAISPEVFAQSVAALSSNDSGDNYGNNSGNEEANQPTDTPTREEIKHREEMIHREEIIYYVMIEFVRRKWIITPSTAQYPSFEERDIDNQSPLKNKWWFNTKTTEKYHFIKLPTCWHLTCWHAYFDAQNSFGAMLRNYVDFVFDDNNNLIYAEFRHHDGKVEHIPLDLITDLQIPEDSIESELYEKYMSDFINSGPYMGWSYPPYNSKMLVVETVRVILSPDIILFPEKAVDIKVTYLLTWIISRDTIKQVYVVLDGKNTFNLIREIVVDDSLEGYAKFKKSDESKN